jgi:23S rRNA pseudouridine2605 synthase
MAVKPPRRAENTPPEPRDSKPKRVRGLSRAGVPSSAAKPKSRSGKAPSNPVNRTLGASNAGSSAPTSRPKGSVGKAPSRPRKSASVRPVGHGGVENLERLQKILAHAGIDSRRKCEELILAGRVHVNGQLVMELGAKADPSRDEITLDFQPLRKEEPVYILLNKPKGYMTTVQDDEGRPTVMALLHGVSERVYPVGRLDFNTEGMLLLTNDGALAQRLSSPDAHIPKIYMVKVHRIPAREALDDLRSGFMLDGRRLKPCRIDMVERTDNPWLRVTLVEGKNRQIRRMFEAVGHPVHKLRRVQYACLEDPTLKPGDWRFLNKQEIATLRAL